MKNVFDNSKEMVAFKHKELMRAIKYVGHRLERGDEPKEVLDRAISNYGFNIGYRAFEGIVKNLK
jgi:hypothetical protein